MNHIFTALGFPYLKCNPQPEAIALTHWFLTLADAAEKLEHWRRYYNE